jgi:hypothetical protein
VPDNWKQQKIVVVARNIAENWLPRAISKRSPLHFKQPRCDHRWPQIWILDPQTLRRLALARSFGGKYLLSLTLPHIAFSSILSTLQNIPLRKTFHDGTGHWNAWVAADDDEFS